MLESVMCTAVTLLCHWPPCSLELEPYRGPARLKHLVSLCSEGSKVKEAR